jgi:hypothetical protein
MNYKADINQQRLKAASYIRYKTQLAWKKNPGTSTRERT